MNPITHQIDEPKPPLRHVLFAGVAAFLFVISVGKYVLPETIGTFVATIPERLVAGLVGGLAVAATVWMLQHRRQTLPPWAIVVSGAIICLAPGWVFMDPLVNYWIYGDDWEYVASSRTFARTIENLFTPHNVHVVPVWRLVSWVVVASAGSLARLPQQMALAAYSCLVANMLLAGRFVAKETRSTTAGLTTMALMGTSSVMQSAGTWFSAAQVLGASFGTLMVLWYLQGWRRYGGAVRLALAVVSVAVAGWSWTVGYVAGPVGAAYLVADARRRCLIAAILMLIAPGVIGGATLLVAGKAIKEQSTISFHGRDASQALNPSAAIFHTIQAIPERLLLGNLGAVGEWNLNQASILVAGLGLVWYFTRRGKGWVTPLELAGLTFLTSSYAIEWVFRGYLPFNSLRGFVPWYDAIPQVGFALFVSGWWTAAQREPTTARDRIPPLNWGSLLAILTLQVGMAGLAAPRCDQMMLKLVRPMAAAEVKVFPIPRLQRLWAVYVASNRAERQQRMFARIDRAEAVARTRGWGRDALRPILGRTLWPDPPVIDDVDMLDLPRTGAPVDPTTARSIFGPAFFFESEPRPGWVPPTDPWNPKNSQ